MSDASPIFSHRLLSHPAEIACLVDALEIWEKERGIDTKTARYLGLMLDELLANIAGHAYQSRQDGRIEVCATFDGNMVLITLRDFGPPFDPTVGDDAADFATDIDARKFGGFGVHFVRRIADHLCYRRDGDANEIVFGKAISADNAKKCKNG